MARWWVACGILVATSASIEAAEAPAALTVRLVRPDAQCARLLDLFRGARSPHPAAALAAWRNATGQRLSKSTEALIAAFNPAMVPELKVLDDAVVALRLDPEDGHLRWSATLPRDNGTFAALATALVLTDGEHDAPVGDSPVDRLGPPGAPLMARVGERLVVAGARDDLETALAQPPAAVAANAAPGIALRLDPAALGQAGPVVQRRFAEALRALGCRAVRGRTMLEDDSLSVEFTAELSEPADGPDVDPHWLAWAPADSALEAIALAVDSRPTAWDRAFALADRIERVDPARAGVAPLRTRLNLVAAAAKVRPEVDLWPVLRGVTACALAKEGEVTGVLVAMHAADEPAAQRIEDTVLPRLLARVPPTRPLRIARRGATVAVGWGEDALAQGLDAFDHPDRSAERLVGDQLRGDRAMRIGIAWPGRLRGVAGTTLGAADVPPVVWWGRNEGRITRDLVRWTGLRGLVRRFLDRLPLDPPPDR